MYNNFLFLSSVWFSLLIFHLFAERSAENDGALGWLQESRRDAKNSEFNSTERAPVLKNCVGKVCVRSTHIQTGHVTLSCKDFIEFDEKVGQCREIVGEQLPGQIDKICLCDGNFCNGIGRLKVPSLLLLLSIALAIPVLLLLLNAV